MPARTLSAAIAACLALSPAPADDPKPADKPAPKLVKVGDSFPKIALKAINVEKVPGKKAGDTVSIADLKGKTVVVFFYPKANTKGCTTESCGFRDVAEKFPADAVLVGASADGVKDQQKFADEYKLPYPLLCDPDLKLIDALGLRADKGKVAKRITVVVDKAGKVAKVYDTVKPTEHPKDVLKYVDALK